MIDFVKLCEGILAGEDLLEEALNVNALIPIATEAIKLREAHKRAIANDDYKQAVELKDRLLAEREKATEIFEEKDLTVKGSVEPKNLTPGEVDRFIKLYVFGNRKEIQPDGTYGKFDPIPRLQGLVHLSLDMIKRVEQANEQIRM